MTLLVTPHQANLLDLGQNKGTLHLSLRNLQDDEDANTRPATLADLRFRQEKPWDEKAKGFLSVLGQALARLMTPAPVPTPARPGTARHRSSRPPPAPPRPRHVTIYRGTYRPIYESHGPDGDGEPRAEGLADAR